VSSVSPRRELGAYEALWLEKGATFKSLAERFAADPTATPSDLVPAAIAEARAAEVLTKLSKAGVSRFGTRLNLTGNYPTKLRDARHPVEILYFQGTWELAETRCVAVVGSRTATEDGLRRAAKISRALVEKGFTVVSGLALGIDSAAHTAAIEAGGATIAVIGTPIGVYYPKENEQLQRRISPTRMRWISIGSGSAQFGQHAIQTARQSIFTVSTAPVARSWQSIPRRSAHAARTSAAS
jgi:DNA processing protein